MMTSLHTGVTGLAAQGEAMNVIGDNIANSKTTGFKASRAEFEDMMARHLTGILGGNEVGRGVRVSSVTPIITQGSIDHTEKSTDIAIDGRGYFVVKGHDGQSFSRDGSFHFDKDGFLVNNEGHKIQGYKANEKGKMTNELGDVRFPKALIPAQSTSRVDIDMNLDSRVMDRKVFDPKNPHDTSHTSTGVEIYDSQGNKHLVTIFFNKTADRTWEFRGMVDGAEITGAEDDKLAEVLAGRMTFTEDGKLDTEQVMRSNWNFRGGATQNQKIEINFGQAIASEGGDGLRGSKQYGSKSEVITWKQDGHAAGTISDMSFNGDGVLTALYNNGHTADLSQLALAKFENPEALFKVGHNRLKQSRESGEVAIGKAMTSGRGRFFAKSLERSTVDLANEFVNLIQTQRAFQANAKTITTTDEMLAEVINLKR